MDDATEQLLLRKLDTAKCTPKYSQASALGARRSLRAMLGAKGRLERKASRTSRASTATFEFRNRRRTKVDLVAVEGLDSRGVKDLHVKKPRAKNKRRPTPHTADIIVDVIYEDEIFENSCASEDAEVQFSQTGGAITATFFGDTAPTAPDDTFNTDPKRKVVEKLGDEFANACKQRKISDGFDLRNVADFAPVLVEAGKRPRDHDEMEPRCKPIIFIQPAQTIPRTIARREGAIESVRVEAASCGQVLVKGEISDVVRVQLVETPYGKQEFVASFKDEHTEWADKEAHVQGISKTGASDGDNVEVKIVGVRGITGMSGPFEPRKHSNSRNDSFARAPTQYTERVGAQIETRRCKVKLVETDPISTESYRRKRLCVDEGCASSAEAANLHSAPEHAGPIREDKDVSVDSNLTLMWRARGNPERSDTYVSDLVDARPAWEHPDFDWGGDLHMGLF